jgi:phosphate uptake regulator
MEIRKVQKVGHSTLTVSLPRDWVEQVGLKQGNVVTLRRTDDGCLRLVPGLASEKTESTTSRINADLCKEHEMLSRIITGNYVEGRDSVVITSSKDLTSEHLWEIRSTVQRLMGLSIVEQTPKQVVIQSFVDPSKFPVSGLIQRLHRVGLSMQEAAVTALLEKRQDIAGEVLQMENEADRIYWLIVRQLILATTRLTAARDIGVFNPQHALGNRIVSKYLECIADCAENMAKEVIGIKDEDYERHRSVLDEIAEMNDAVRLISENTMKAFVKLDAGLANKSIEDGIRAQSRDRKISEKIVDDISNRNVALALRSITWNLTETARYCQMIAEVTINRYLEEPSELCDFKKVE